MQQHSWVILGVGVIAIMAAGLYYAVSRPSVYESKFLSSPWIEIISSGVSLEEGNSSFKNLGMGDNVPAGSIIVSDGSGKATIHFPDGSAIRLDNNSKISIAAAQFDPETETLKVKIFLFSGRVWSKVAALVTPESSWEVKTAGAVTTVRGTAFSVEYTGGKSVILGSQNTVFVNPVDPKTGDVLLNIQAEIKENMFIEVNDKDASVIAERLTENKKAAENLGIALFSPRRVSQEILNSSFVKENKSEDKIFDEKVEIIRKEGLKDREVREVLRTESKNFRDKILNLKKSEKNDEEIKREILKEDAADFRARVKEQAKIIKEGAKSPEPASSAKDAEQIKAPAVVSPNVSPATPSVPSTSGSGSPAPRKISRLTIGGFSKISIAEGSRVSLVATIVFDNGEQQDITKEVSWTVGGFVGSVENGIFIAKLRPEDSEVGEIKGSIQAKIEIGGSTYASNIIEFIVTPSVTETIPIG